MSSRCDVIESPRKISVQPPRIVTGRDDIKLPRMSTCSGMSASSEDTSDSGFFQTVADTSRLSPRPLRIERKFSGLSDSNDSEDIDFFLKVVSDFRDYVAEKIEGLEEQHRINESYLNDLQVTLKESEARCSEREVEVSKDITHLVALLHKRQNLLLENLKKHRTKSSNCAHEKMDQCRRNMKVISGVLSYARRVKNETDDTIREKTLKDLKQRFLLASERSLPTVEDCDEINDLWTSDLGYLKEILENPTLGPNHCKISKQRQYQELLAPLIMAPTSPRDVTKNCIYVRWSCDVAGFNHVTYQVFWSYMEQGNMLERNVTDVVNNCFVVRDLPPNCEVTVQVQAHCSSQSSELSQPAFFKTAPQPAKFTLDAETANAKLQLSPDLMSVYFPGESGANSSVSKSPARFSFALNVLGSVSFYTGRHYWEVLVNKDGWAVGVAYRSVPRNSWFGSNDSSWILHYNPAKKEFKVRHRGESDDITLCENFVPENIGRIGIYIDYEAGILSFVECQRKNVLYTFNTRGFREPVCAAINPFYHGGALTVITGLEVPELNFGN